MRSVVALVLVLLVSTAFASFLFQQPKLERSLKEKLAKNGAKSLPVLVNFEKLNIRRYTAVQNVDKRAEFLVNDLRLHAELTQASVVARLREQNVVFKQLWISNQLSIRNCPVSVINWLATHPLVTKVSLDEERADFGIVSETQIVDKPAQDSHEWNVEYVQATKVWNELKHQGEGVVVGIIDTGAEYKHAAIASQYRGLHEDGSYDHNYNWFQTIGMNHSAPVDDNSHGTHVAGTILGRDKGHTYGLAPKAQFISCKCFAGASGTKASVTECLQWMMAPTDLKGENPDPSKRPHLTSNSWGCNGACDLEDPVEALVAAGVMVVAAAGNAGPSCGSVSDPGGLEVVLAVGALETKKDNVTSFSSRGPYRFDGSSRIKPDVTAPGRDILSSVLNGAYGKKSGTSMACPHVSGAVALVYSAIPDLKRKPKETQELLQKYARNVDVSGTYCNSKGVPNNMYGFGTLQVYDAIKGAKKL